MYKLKQLPEDFVVEEINDFETQDNGKFIYLLLQKKNRNTLDCVKEIAKQLHIKSKDVGFAGSKDKNALTLQVISLKGISKEKIKQINLDNVTIEILGFANQPVSLGDLQGNKFEITVRNLDSFKVKETNFVANYFDEQRFSVHNAKIGKHLVKKEFEEAVKLMEDTSCKEHLSKHKHDFIGAMKKLPKRLLMMYVHAYQSYLWNETLAKYLEKNCNITKRTPYSLGDFVFVNQKKNLKIPLIGFNDDLINIETKEIVEELLEKETISYFDFVIKQIPKLSLEGDLRSAFVEIKNLIINKEEVDELNGGKKKVKISFCLGKGSYATMVVRKLLNNFK